MISGSRHDASLSNGQFLQNDEKTPSPLNTATNMNRRGLFTSLARRSSDLGMAGIAASCGLISVNCLTTLGSIPTLEDDLKKEPAAKLVQENSRKSYFTVTHPNGATIDVIGLNHTEEHYALCKDTLTERVMPADIVLFEQGDFFQKNFRQPAEARGKITAPVEGIFTNLKGVASMSIGLWVCALKVFDQVKPGIYFLATALRRDNSRRLEPEHAVKRRQLLKDVLKMGTYLYVGVGGGQRLADHTQNQRYILADISPLSDGRSMKMWANALTWAEKNPGARIAVVVGDAHARAIRFYTSTPGGRIAFAVKNPIYNVAYLNCLDFTA